MKKKRSALFTSLLALLLCVSMLMGTTLAWFTDSVSSQNNQILAGSLDVELEQFVDGKWVSVNESTNVFEKDALWEPGRTEVVYLRVRNAGDLALKYGFGVNVASETGSVNVLGNEFKLSDHIRYGIVLSDSLATYADRASARAALQVSQLINQAYTSDAGSLLPAGEKYVTLVVYMPEEVGNEANYATGAAIPTVNLGLRLMATQEVHESDSFGSDYDASAEIPGFDFPDTNVSDSASTKVDTDGAGKVSEAVTMQGSQTAAEVPAGVQLEGGATELKLTVNDVDQSQANLTLGDNESQRSVDVHIEGVAADNTVPMTITLRELAPKGLNMGNYKLYHVEGGVAVEMSYVASDAAFSAHNQFKYDPATGDVVLHMATFSEIAMTAEKDNAWKGEFDYTWYTNAVAPIDGEAVTEYTIANADQLAAFGAIVGGMADGTERDSFSGQTVKLISDINLGYGVENHEYKIFYPIGYYNNTGSYTRTSDSVTSNVSSFSGTFDGQGHTIANFYQNTWEMFGDYNDGYSAGSNYYKDAMGLFGYVYGGTIKNLTVDNFSSDGEYTPTGVIAAYAVNSTFENIAITNCNPRVYNTGNGGIVGIGGNSDDPDAYKLTFNNITLDNTNKITALWGSWDVACGGLVGMFRGAGHVYMTNCHVAAQIDVYNDVCGNYQYYWYRYSGMMVGTNQNMTTDKDGYTVPETSKFHAENCTVHFGDWNDYYYCELVANSLASYTHDHQFSRLTQIQNVSEIQDTNGNWKQTGNFILMNGKTPTKTCYHIMKDANGNLYEHKHDVPDATNPNITETVNGETVLKENNQRIYLPFNQLFTGYGWGVKHIPVYNGEDYAFEGITILDRKTADSVEKFETKFTGDFLYRVGTLNAVNVGTIFEAKSGAEINSSGVYVTITSQHDDNIVMGSFTTPTKDQNGDGKTDWQDGQIKFDKTGIAKVTIQDYDYCTPTVLYVEVVDAYNRTTASFSDNSVLLNDVSTTTTLSTSGVIYGNGFTVNMENAPISEKNGAVFHLYDGAHLKNLNIVGKEFTTVAQNVNNTNYGVSAVRAWGTVIIEDCYISGCRAPISVTGTELTIKDSVIANGVYANVDFRSGILNLHNVTTINEPHTVNGTTVVGLGIVGNMTASAGRQLNVSGYLKQHNWLSKEDCAKVNVAGANAVYEPIFTDATYAKFRYTYNGTSYVNTGILSLNTDFGQNAVKELPDGYVDEGVPVSGTLFGITVNGYVWSLAEAGTLTDDDMKYHSKVANPDVGDQGTSYIPPAFDFSNSGLEVENGVVQISYESGSSYTLSNEVLKLLLIPKKYGKDLPYKISMDGTDYTNSDITFNGTESKSYTIIYTITDNQVYDANGNYLKDKTYEVTAELKVFVTVVDKKANAPTFTFYYGTNGKASAGTPHTTQPTNSYTSTIKQVGEAYYIMPNVSATSANAIGSKTVDGTTIYYPIVDGINVRSGSSSDYDFTRYYPVFKAVKISDNGTEYSYSGTKEMPATVTWVSAEIDSGNGASSLNDGFGLYNNQYLCKIQKKAGNAEAGGTSVVKFSYVALDGNTYSYYVGFRFYDEDEGGLCVTADTLVTLADGSQKRIDQVTYDDQLLVWDFYKGAYATVPAAIIFDHGYDNNTVIKLNFSDGTTVKAVNLHQFFDADLNQLVSIDANTVADYVGHKFVKQNGKGYKTVTLVDYTITEEYCEAWGIISAEHYNIFVEGMLSTDFMLEDFELFNYFEVGKNLKFDEKKMQADIVKYGLYTYEDFAEYLTYEQFVAFNVQYFKIPVGKGEYTYEGILKLIDTYLNAN